MARSHYRANAAKECPSHPQQAQTWTQVQSCGAARPIHNPTFVIHITLNNQLYVGTGRSKKEAKHNAADEVLKSFVQFKDTCEVKQAIRSKSCSLVNVGQKRCLSPETPSEFVGKMSCGGDQTSLTIAVEEQTNAPATNNDEPASKRQKLLSNYSEKIPVMLLNELEPGLKYTTGESGYSPAMNRFIMTVEIEGQAFEGSGASKKLAKQACARSALTKLYHLSFTPMLRMPEGSGFADQINESGQELVPGR